jgi:glycosyltransferase involved in cell wall biosynthesis
LVDRLVPIDHPIDGEALLDSRPAAGPIEPSDLHQRPGGRDEVEPHVDGRSVRFVGPVGPADRDRLLGGALALLHLVTFEEPFGLAMVEAMACGTPVIATRRGAVPEIVADGETGFIVPDLGAAARALVEVRGLDRARCRAAVEERFTVDRMVDRYEAVYQRVLETWRARPGAVAVRGMLG